MPNPPLPLPEEPGEPDDASLLWSDDEPVSKPSGESESESAAAEPRAEPGESYDLIERESAVGGEGETSSTRRPVPAPWELEPARRGSRREQEGAHDDVVDVLYTRWGEWWPAILRLAGLMFGTLVAVYFSLDLGSFAVTGGLLLIGMAAGVVLSYPLLVTLERPVRFTPEQALRDYYGALEHYFPQVRRMWLLLSREGRQSSRFASFEGFQRYWESRLAALRGEAAVSSWTPLVFEVIDYQGEKSGDLEELTAKFQVKVSARGHRANGPIATIPVEARLLRGPDRQWYLRDGMLPEAESKS